MVAVEAPRRPVSAVGLDGASVTVSAPSRRADLATWLKLEQLAAEQATATSTAAADDGPRDADEKARTETALDLEVRVDEPAEVGLVEGIIGAVIGFLFG